MKLIALLATLPILSQSAVVDNMAIVQVGRTMQDNVALPEALLRDGKDIVFDRRTRSLFVIEGRVNCTIHQFDVIGKRLKSWAIPVGWKPLTGMFFRDDKYEFIAARYETIPVGGIQFLGQTPQQFGLISWSVVDNSLQLSPLAQPWSLSDDTSLNPETSGHVHKILKQVRYVSMPLLGGQRSSAGPPDYELVFINAPPLGNDLVEVASDVSVVVFGWNVSEGYIAVKRRAGGLAVHPVASLLPPQLQRELTPRNGVPASLRSAVLYSNLAILGVLSNRVHSLIWVDLSSESPKVVKQSPGRLARHIRHF